VTGKLGKAQIDRAMQLAHTIAKLLNELFFQTHQLAQFLQRRLGQLGNLRPLLSSKTRDAQSVNGIGLGTLQLLFGKAATAERIDQRNLKPCRHQRSEQIAPAMTSRLHCHQAVARAPEQLQQSLIASRVFHNRRGLEHHRATLVDNRDHVPLATDIDPRKPHQLRTSCRSLLPKSSTPILTLLLVHTRTLCAPLDTVRALKYRARAPISPARTLSLRR
jgi:hypothetical protein